MVAKLVVGTRSWSNVWADACRMRMWKKLQGWDLHGSLRALKSSQICRWLTSALAEIPEQRIWAAERPPLKKNASKYRQSSCYTHVGYGHHWAPASRLHRRFTDCLDIWALQAPLPLQALQALQALQGQEIEWSKARRREVQGGPGRCEILARCRSWSHGVMALNSLSWARARHAECLEKFLPQSSILNSSVRKSLKTPEEQQKTTWKTLENMKPIFSRPQISSPAIAELCDAPVPQELADGDRGIPGFIRHKHQSLHWQVILFWCFWSWALFLTPSHSHQTWFIDVHCMSLAHAHLQSQHIVHKSNFGFFFGQHFLCTSLSHDGGNLYYETALNQIWFGSWIPIWTCTGYRAEKTFVTVTVTYHRILWSKRL